MKPTVMVEFYLEEPLPERSSFYFGSSLQQLIKDNILTPGTPVPQYVLLDIFLSGH